MSFKALSESQIVANLINTYSSLITTADDVTTGSVIRSVFEAFAQELKRYYQNAQESASEVQKSAAYATFGFSLLPAQAAYTMETISADAPASNVTIPSGTTFAKAGTNVQYKTVAVNTFASGTTTLDVRVVCTQVGTIGNAFADTITQLVSPISGLSNVSVTNAKDVRNGTELETDDQRANRFQEYIQSLHSGDLRALKYGAKLTKILDNYGYISEQVTKAQVIEGSGSNTIYIDNGTYDTSDNLVTECQKVINGYTDDDGKDVRGYKASGVPSTVTKATIQTITVSVNVAAKPGYTFATIQTSVSNSIKTLVQSLDVGQDLTMNALNLAIGQTPGVLNFQITSPVADTSPADGTLLKLASDPTIGTL